MLSKELNALAGRFGPHAKEGMKLSPKLVTGLVAELRTMARDAARRFGPGLIAEDLPDQLPAVVKNTIIRNVD